MTGHIGQSRATRTRDRLVESSAAQFALRGYDGTSFARICEAAGVTMGALTFHFPSKAALAQAVCTTGIEATRVVVDDADQRGGTPLESVGNVTRAVAGLLRERGAAQAAARLSREQPPLHMDWRESWLPLVRTRLRQAAALKQLHPTTRPESAALLVSSLVAGVEVGLLSEHGNAAPPAPGPPGRLAELWQTALRGIGAWQHEDLTHAP
ncbi:TetR/AcrR family transcriptional regulator [Streptomyces fuscigenes]|uniref:TetR/AcrR family transcriptional regulator n=1 Tax=Streptomyces fuscigenes TaxID=1528880 RepID=UPI001F403EA8|nr:TetR/AcrR family transcriptional regulator [Streptomyces fuscigenes]MCF3960171.1 TetR family transcriptional regulator [Streptomyces fuscigenes]